MDDFSKRFKELRRELVLGVVNEPLLCVASDVEISLLNESHINGISSLYTQALNRGDWFAGEYNSVNDFSPSSDFFKSKIDSEKLIWFVFCQKGVVVGATQLALCKNGSVIIDETQLDPEKGRGLKIMDHYFRRVVPIIEGLGIPYWTEFVLTPGSKSLRRTLISEMGMVVTGIRLHNYKSQFNTDERMMSCLVAHGKGCNVRLVLERIIDTAKLSEIISFTNTLLGMSDVIETSRENIQPPNDNLNQNLTIPVNEESKVLGAINNGYSLVGIDPFDLTISLSSLKNSRFDELYFLKNEKIECVDRFMKHVLAGY